MPDFQLSNGKN